MKTRGLMIIISSGFVVLGGFTNCEQHVNFTNVRSLKTPTEVKKACESKAHIKKTVPVHFPKPNQTCEWNQNGNLDPQNAYFQGRIEQTAAIDLPAGATICNMDFTFPTQQFLYDDHFLMTFNNKVLASSYNFDGIISEFNGLLDYAWSSIAGILWNEESSPGLGREGVFCTSVTGTDGLEHGSNCSWPITDTPGQIAMEFPKEVIYATMANDLKRTSHEFKFITIGDNDDLDCEHSDIQFTVDIEYIQ